METRLFFTNYSSTLDIGGYFFPTIWFATVTLSTMKYEDKKTKKTTYFMFCYFQMKESTNVYHKHNL